jgi:hypothetical protein
MAQDYIPERREINEMSPVIAQLSTWSNVLLHAAQVAGTHTELGG